MCPGSFDKQMSLRAAARHWLSLHRQILTQIIRLKIREGNRRGEKKKKNGAREKGEVSVCVESRKGDSVEPIPERGSRGPAQDQKPPDAAGECCAARPAPSLPIRTSDLGGDTVPFALRGRSTRRAGEVSRGTKRGGGGIFSEML